MQYQDQELFERVKKNDDQYAFRIIFDRYYSSLCIYSNRFLQDETAAKDIVQLVFIRIWERRKEINLKVSMAAYLFRSVRNETINFLKHSLVTRKDHEHLEERHGIALESLKISREEGMSVLIAQELLEEYMKGIGMLPEQCQKIFKMSRFDGLTHPQIARSLNLSLNTVEKQISRALQKLRVYLKEFL